MSSGSPNAMREVKDRVTYCSVCSNITEADPCYFCTHPDRDHRVICVVEQPENVTAIEKTREFKGLYHADGRAVAAARIGPDDLKIKPLLSRVGTREIEEVILATNPNVEGEATAIYLARLLKPLGPRVTRIAMVFPSAPTWNTPTRSPCSARYRADENSEPFAGLLFDNRRVVEQPRQPDAAVPELREPRRRPVTRVEVRRHRPAGR